MRETYRDERYGRQKATMGHGRGEWREEISWDSEGLGCFSFRLDDSTLARYWRNCMFANYRATLPRNFATLLSRRYVCCARHLDFSLAMIPGYGNRELVTLCRRARISRTNKRIRRSRAIKETITTGNLRKKSATLDTPRVSILVLSEPGVYDVASHSCCVIFFRDRISYLLQTFLRILS